MSNVQIGVRVRPSKKLPKPGVDRYDEKLAAAVKEQYGPDTGYYMCIAMPEEGGQYPTKVQLIQSPGEESEAIEYSFPHCFWSHDKNQYFADQPHVYSRIGKPLLYSLYQGSGKTYTMMGIDHKDIICDKVPPNVVAENFGVIPRVFRDLASDMTEPGVKMKVDMAFVEIYNEKLNDLLVDRKQPMDITVAHDSKGRSVFNNKKVADKDSPQRRCSYTVANLESLEEFYRVGNTRRAVAATQMNASSSRSHSLVVLDVTRKAPGQKQTTGQLFLVDLAGSERLSKTGASEQTLIEGTFINLSLTVLGKVIDDVAHGRKVASFRESLLAMCLKNAIGGNCLTVVFGALGPSSDNKGETKNTLDFCQRASLIQCKAVKDESSAGAGSGALAELRQENEFLQKERERLTKMLEELKVQEKGGQTQAAPSAEAMQQLEELRRQLEEKELAAAESQRKLQNAELFEISEEEMQMRMKQEADEHFKKLLADLAAEGIAADDSNIAVLVNLSQDNSQDGIVRYALPFKRVTKLGSGPENDVRIQAYRVKRFHCTIENNKDNSEIYITPEKGAETRVNGQEITQRTRLKQHDRLCFGTDLLFFLDAKQKSSEAQPTWNIAMKEVTKGRGLLQDDEAVAKQRAELEQKESELRAMQANLASLQAEAKEKEQERIRQMAEKVRAEKAKVNAEMLNGQQLMEMINLASVATDLCADMHISPAVTVEATMQTVPTSKGERNVEVMAVVTIQGHEEKFMCSKSLINDLVAYLQECRVQLEDNADAKLSPFDFNIPNQLVGYSMFNVRNLLYLCDYGVDDDDPSTILPAQLINQQQVSALVGGEVFAALKIEAPVTEADEQDFLEDVEAVISAWKRLRDRKAKVKISVVAEKAQSLPVHASKGTYASFSIFGEQGATKVNSEKTTKPRWDYQKSYEFPVTDSLIDWLTTGSVIMEVYYTPDPVKLVPYGKRDVPAPEPIRAASPEIRPKPSPAPVVVQTNDGEVERLKAELSQLHHALDAQTEEKQREIAELKTRLDAAQSAVKTLESVSTGTGDNLQVQVVRLTKELAEERAKQAALVPVDKLSEAKSQLLTKQEEIDKALAEAKKAQAEAQKLQAQVQKLEQEKAELAKGGGSKACTLL